MPNQKVKHHQSGLGFELSPSQCGHDITDRQKLERIYLIVIWPAYQI
jgi:hypothetical protein